MKGIGKELESRINELTNEEALTLVEILEKMLKEKTE